MSYAHAFQIASVSARVTAFGRRRAVAVKNQRLRAHSILPLPAATFHDRAGAIGVKKRIQRSVTTVGEVDRLAANFACLDAVLRSQVLLDDGHSHWRTDDHHPRC